MKLFLMLAMIATCAHADTIVLKSGGSIEGEVLQKTEEKVVFRKGKSTFTYPIGLGASIKIDPKSPVALVVALPSGDDLVAAFAKQPWGANLEQIPATVIDKGVLKFVPYVSHQSGDYELNVYGDPEKPAGIELGIYRRLLTQADVKEECIRFAASVVGASLKSSVLKAKRDKDSVAVGDWTIEITPPDAEDAYGGWWISIYSEKALDASRASAEELKAITSARQIKAAAVPAVAVAAPTRPMTGDTTAPDWSPTDLSRARISAAGGGGGGSVYVRGYTRKDGTYVQSHTRSAPSRGGRR